MPEQQQTYLGFMYLGLSDEITPSGQKWATLRAKDTMPPGTKMSTGAHLIKNGALPQESNDTITVRLVDNLKVFAADFNPSQGELEIRRDVILLLCGEESITTLEQTRLLGAASYGILSGIQEKASCEKVAATFGK